MQVTNTVKQIKKFCICHMPEAKLSFSRSTEYFSLTLANCNSSLRPSDAMKRARIFYFIDEWHESVQKRECSGIYRRQISFPSIACFTRLNWFDSWKLAFYSKFTMYSQMRKWVSKHLLFSVQRSCTMCFDLTINWPANGFALCSSCSAAHIYI